MGIIKNMRLGLLHVAMAVTLVPITSVLNRVMINELGLLASVVAVLIILPYLLSPLQVWIGNYSDQHPLWGYRRTPYIAGGLLLCAVGVALAPHVALLMHREPWLGGLAALLVFGGWGLGYNMAVVSYLSLASDLSEEHQRSRTIAIMWFMMITSVIFTAVITGRALDPYSEPQLLRVFAMVGVVSAGLAALGLVGLEPRKTGDWRPETGNEGRVGHMVAVQAVIANPQARRFFLYMVLMLSAVLGQDVLLEPFGAQVFGWSVRETTQLTATWGGMTLLSLMLYGLVLNRWISKKTGAYMGGVLGAVGLLLIAASGMLHMEALFVPGVATLGFGTGIATATNLGLMLDMTTPEQVGLFIGAWGVADSLARGTGNLLAGVVRDLVAHGTGSLAHGYISVFLIEAAMLGFSLLLLRQINVAAFRNEEQSLTRIVALAGDA
ncbi:MAG: BCD family MFS transporter [Chloroflexaceae bacterium]|jgi:BCD family chlorophyll transporter-like MFS transporter|nr:BCD family MFS transporter [Chloroflexaceae bacterium]